MALITSDCVPRQNGLVKPGTYTNSTGTYDLGVAMAAATCIHPSHQEFGVTSGRPRVVGFFDCVMQAELIACQVDEDCPAPPLGDRW